MSISSEQALYILMDDNYEKYLPGETLWRKLRAVDKELEPGCIYMEDFKAAGASRHSQRAFREGEKTLVLRLKTEENAEDAVDCLTKIFRGAGPRFVVEKTDFAGQHAFQIRSNIDKLHWEKLAVVCKHRFDREIPKEERAAAMDGAQATIDHFIAKTDCKSWHALEGMPAFCSLMGLHGILRAKERVSGSNMEREASLNKPHPRGTPYLFEDVVMHVDVSKEGMISGLPYTLGYNANRDAMHKTVEHRLWNLVMEGLGGDPTAPAPVANKALRAAGFGLGVTALTHGDFNPLLVTGVAGVALVVGFVRNRWQVLGRLDELEKRREEFFKLLKQQAEERRALKPATLEVHDEKAFAPLQIKQLMAELELTEPGQAAHLMLVKHHAQQEPSAARERFDNHLDAVTRAGVVGLGGLLRRS